MATMYILIAFASLAAIVAIASILVIFAGLCGKGQDERGELICIGGIILFIALVASGTTAFHAAQAYDKIHGTSVEEIQKQRSQ